MHLQPCLSNAIGLYMDIGRMIGRYQLKPLPTGCDMLSINKGAEKWASWVQKVKVYPSFNFYSFGFSTLYRSYHNGQLGGQRKPVHTVGQGSVLKLPTNGKQLPAFPLEVGPGTEARSQRWETRVLPLCHRGPYISFK